MRRAPQLLMARGATERKLPSADDADVAGILKQRSISSSDLREQFTILLGVVHLCHLRNLRTIDC